MTTDKLIELLQHTEGKELVVIADSKTFKIGVVVNCMNDNCVLLQCFELDEKEQL